MNKFELLGIHYFNEVLKPSRDSNSWLAYLVLREIYPSINYWSYDGFHVDALVDYSRNILWEDDEVKSIDRSVVYRDVQYLYTSSTEYILQEWVRNICA